MTKKTEAKAGSDSDALTNEFVKKNWPIALVLTGSIVGAVVWLTARYLRNKKEHSDIDDRNLKQIESEAAASLDPTATLLNGGEFLGSVAGSKTKEATLELEPHLPSADERDAMSTLGDIAEIEARS